MSLYLKAVGYLLSAALLTMPLVTTATSQNNTVMDQELTICQTLAELRQHSGQRIIILGVYHHPGNKRLEQMKLVLKDSSVLVLHPGEAKIAMLSEANTGKTMQLTGKFYEDHIPEIYELESRTNVPVLVAIEKVELKP